MATIAETQGLDQLSELRLPTGTELDILLDLLEQNPSLIDVVRDIAARFAVAVPDIREIGLGVSPTEPEPGEEPVIFVEGYTAAPVAEATSRHRLFSRDIVVGELFPRGIYNVNTALRFLS